MPSVTQTEGTMHELPGLQDTAAAPATPAPGTQLTAAPITIPPLNDGELWAGIVSISTQLHHVILLPGEFDDNWNASMAWAKEQSGDLPSPLEQKLLIVNLKDQFKPEWYWSDEQHASDESSAWMQDFLNGFQLYFLKDYGYRARAVRRLPIQ